MFVKPLLLLFGVVVLLAVAALVAHYFGIRFYSYRVK